MLMKKISLISLLLSLAFLTSGCTLFNLSNQEADSATSGGIFKTINGGETWLQPVKIASTDKPLNIASLNTISLEVDPSDSQAIYYGSLANGLFYSYDGAASWHPAYKLGPMPIGGVAIDPTNKCIIYVVSNNKVYKSIDCNRTWTEMYVDNNYNAQITSIIVDHYQPTTVFMTNIRGDIIKSLDGGVTWQTLYNFDDAVRKVVMSPHDSRIMMVATVDEGLFRSTDNGASWQDLSKILKKIEVGNDIRDLIVSKKDPGTWLIATKYGLVKTVNDGSNWTKIKLIPPDNETRINAIAFGNQATQLIYYITNTNFYSSIDGGENWASHRLPTSRRGWRLLVDPNDDKIVYLGVSQKQ